MRRTFGGFAAVVALAIAAFSAAYFGGGALTSPEPAKATGAALRAPALVVDSRPVAMRTPTPTPTPKATATPKPKKHAKKSSHKKKGTKKTTAAQSSTPRYTATAVPTRVATAVPTQVYHPPVQQQQQPRSNPK